MINTSKDFNKYIAITILVMLAIFIFVYTRPYINGFFGAFILFALFLPLHIFFTERLNINKNISAIFILILTILIILIPTYFIISSSYNEVMGFLDQKDTFLEQITDFDERYPNLDLVNRIDNAIPTLTNFTTDYIFKNISNIFKMFITLLIMYFLLFYLLVYHKNLYKILKNYLPFSPKNSAILAKEFKKVTYATLITTGLVAIFQGLLLGLGFWFFNIKGPVFWGVIAAILSFLPIMGVPLVWGPYAAYYILTQDYFTGIGLIILGLIINYSEYFIRPYFQRKIGNLHPLVSIIGIFMGISAFGFVGIVIGPLILSYFTLTFKMFKEEYLEKEKRK